MIEGMEDLVEPFNNKTVAYAVGTQTINPGETKKVVEVEAEPVLVGVNLIDYMVGSASGAGGQSISLRKSGTPLDSAELGTLTKFLEINVDVTSTYEVWVSNSGGGSSLVCTGMISVIRF